MDDTPKEVTIVGPDSSPTACFSRLCSGNPLSTLSRGLWPTPRAPGLSPCGRGCQGPPRLRH